jgi:hypothetical protein
MKDRATAYRNRAGWLELQADKLEKKARDLAKKA